MPLLVLVVGALSILLLVGTVRLQRLVALDDLALLDAVGKIRADVAVTHLWIEELVSGDQVDSDEIRERLGRTHLLLAVLLGDEPPPAGSELRAVGATASARGALRAEALRLRHGFDEFREMTEDRRVGYERGLEVGIGSDFDVAYDRVFQSLLHQADVFDRALRARRADARRLDTVRLAAIAAAWGGGLALAAFGLWIHERRRRRAESALATSREHLERSQALEALGRFARGLAHDLNNYLAALRAQGELIVQRSDDEHAVDRAGTIIDTVDRASGLLARLLSFGAAGPGGERPNATDPGAAAPVDLSLLLLEARGALEAAVASAPATAPIELELSLERPLAPVRIDPAAFDQLVLNLVVNAGDAMPEGGRVTLETASRPAAGGESSGRRATGREDSGLETLLRVTDTGVGVAPEHREAIFDPFWSAKSGPHCGLGLSIVDDVVRRFGGRIELRSTVGVGSTFEIVFAATGPAPELEEATRGTGRLLLVDPDEEWREATGSLLETLGYDVDLAATLDEAVGMARESPRPDVLLVDLAALDGRSPDSATDSATGTSTGTSTSTTNEASDRPAARLEALRAATGKPPLLVLCPPSHDPSSDSLPPELVGRPGVDRVLRDASTAPLRAALRRVLEDPRSRA